MSPNNSAARHIGRTSRLAATGVFVALVAWDTRHTWNVANVMHGWPFPWNDLWYLGHHEWSWRLLVVDVSVWCLLAAATSSVLSHFQLQGKSCFTVRDLLSAHLALALLFALYLAERNLRASPGNDSIFPRYGRINLFGSDVWFDIGLFTDPPIAWLPVRIIVIVSVGCAAACLFWLLSELPRACRRLCCRLRVRSR